MKEKRTATLMAVLLVLLAGYMLRPQIEAYFYPLPGQAAPLPPLAGKNEIKSITVKKSADDVYTATVEYFYRGDSRYAFARVLTDKDTPPGYTQTKALERGLHSFDFEVMRPVAIQGETISKALIAYMWMDNELKETLKIDYVIEWPDAGTYYQKKERAKKSTDDLYKEAVALIDQDSAEVRAVAQKNLETILLRDPNYVSAYPELARIAMKSNWGPEGLRQAENYLLSGLGIDPKNANVKVLLGYVYAHQKRYKESEAALVEASAIGTNNLWLWANWGELLAMQDKDDLAIEKYMQAVSVVRSYDTYDRARLDAYWHLFKLLEKKKQFDQMDALYKKRADEFEKYPYYLAEYGRFRLTHFGDYQAAIVNAKTALERGCECEEAKYTLGMSYYIAWTKLSGEEKKVAFNQASIFLPEGPKMLYEMARFDETSKVIPELLKKGSSFQLQDNEMLNAMAYALMADDIDAAQRLSTYGARFDELVGPQKYPVGFIAFSKQDVKAIRMMKKRGVDFSAMKFNGLNMIEYAKQLHNDEIIKIVASDTKYPM